MSHNDCANLHSYVHEAQVQSAEDQAGKSYAGHVATASEQSAIASQLSIESGEIVGILKQMFTDREEDLGAAQDLNSQTLEECVSMKALKGSQIALTRKFVLQLHAAAVSREAEADHETGLDPGATRRSNEVPAKLVSNP